jgi:hypothetical protein
MHPDWLRGLRDQVHAAGAKLFVKQIGSNHALWPSVTGKGEDPAQWPADLRIQELPQIKSFPVRTAVSFEEPTLFNQKFCAL